MAKTDCEKLMTSDGLVDKTARHLCFRKKCFREIYDYNARAVVKTRFPKDNIINYYSITPRGRSTEAYEAILKSYNKWVIFSKLQGDLLGYVETFIEETYICVAVHGEYIALANSSAIFIYCNLNTNHQRSVTIPEGLKEMKFWSCYDRNDSVQVYLVATFESKKLYVWKITCDAITNVTVETDIITDDLLCYGTAMNFYTSKGLTIHKYDSELSSGKIVMDTRKKEYLIDLSKLDQEKYPKKTIFEPEWANFEDEKIVALDSNDINIYAVTTRIEQQKFTGEKKVYLMRYVCKDILLICTEGGIVCDYRNIYTPLPKEFNEKTKVYLTMEDFIICTCGKYIAVYDDPIRTWQVTELIDDRNYVETLIVHANLLLIGFNNGKIFGYDVSMTQSLIKPNFFHGPKFTITEINDPIVSFNVCEYPIKEEKLKTSDKDVYYPYILITSRSGTYLFKFTKKYYYEYYINGDK